MQQTDLMETKANLPEAASTKDRAAQMLAGVSVQRALAATNSII